MLVFHTKNNLASDPCCILATTWRMAFNSLKCAAVFALHSFSLTRAPFCAPINTARLLSTTAPELATLATQTVNGLLASVNETKLPASAEFEQSASA